MRRRNPYHANPLARATYGERYRELRAQTQIMKAAAACRPLPREVLRPDRGGEGPLHSFARGIEDGIGHGGVHADDAESRSMPLTPRVHPPHPFGTM